MLKSCCHLDVRPVFAGSDPVDGALMNAELLGQRLVCELRGFRLQPLALDDGGADQADIVIGELRVRQLGATLHVQPVEDVVDHAALVLRCCAVEFARTSASASGGHTELPQRATCLYFGTGLPLASTLIT